METSLSKTISYLLRHGPDDAGLDMDQFGFVSLGRLVSALNGRGWEELGEQELAREIRSPEETRFEIKGNRVRAKYGHSVEVNLDREPITDPGRLYHGTSRAAWNSIRVEGLRPQNRQFVHLSSTREEARRVGLRHDTKPVILAVDPKSNPDHNFFRVSSTVILTKFVPPEWIQRL